MPHCTIEKFQNITDCHLYLRNAWLSYCIIVLKWDEYDHKREKYVADYGIFHPVNVTIQYACTVTKTAHETRRTSELTRTDSATTREIMRSNRFACANFLTPQDTKMNLG